MTSEERAIFDEVAARVRAYWLSRQIEEPRIAAREAWVSALMVEAVLYGVPLFLSSPGWLPLFSQDAIAALVLHNDPERLAG